MVGIELVAERAGRVPYPPAARMGQRVGRAARARGVILRPLGNVIVLMPALAIAPAELERLVDAAPDAIGEATGGLGAPSSPAPPPAAARRSSPGRPAPR